MMTIGQYGQHSHGMGGTASTLRVDAWVDRASGETRSQRGSLHPPPSQAIVLRNMADHVAEDRGMAHTSARGAGMPLNLLATKLFVPPARANLVPRPRLFDRLQRGLAGKLTL